MVLVAVEDQDRKADEEAEEIGYVRADRLCPYSMRPSLKSAIDEHDPLLSAAIVAKATMVTLFVVTTLSLILPGELGGSESLFLWHQRSRRVDDVPVTPGIDVLRRQSDPSLEGRRLGLVTNHTGLAIDGTPSWKVLRDELGFRLVALFSPEHGLDGEVAAGDEVASGRHLPSGLPLFSLYGVHEKMRKPTTEVLRGIDTLVFDIQDIGVRFYTYISTLKLCMEAAAEAGIEVVVLDRPNPNTGLRVEGPVLEPEFQSFVGVAPIALVHGLSVGELALLFNGEKMLEGGRTVTLRVVKMRHWKRSMWWEDTGLPWRATSPNIKTVETTVAYAALGLFEGINVSEGRGTSEPFLIAGAPWIGEKALTQALSLLALPGVDFLPEVFTPRASSEAPYASYSGESCRGFRLNITERSRFQAVRTGLNAIASIRRQHPEQFEWKTSDDIYYIDQLLGTDEPRRRLEAGDSADAITKSWEPALERFRRQRARYLLYPE